MIHDKIFISKWYWSNWYNHVHPGPSLQYCISQTFLKYTFYLSIGQINKAWIYIIWIYHSPLYIVRNWMVRDVDKDDEDIEHRLYPLGKGASIVRRFRTWRREDDLLWANIKVFRTSFYVPAPVNVIRTSDSDVTSMQRLFYVRDAYGRPESFHTGLK